MKKILTVAIAIAVSMSAFAQSNFSIGIGETLRHRMGTNAMAGDDLTKVQSGLMIEATYGYDFIENVGITAGVRFAYEGIYNKSAIESKLLGIKATGKWLNSYLEIPVNAKFTINPDSACKFFITLGPTFSYWTGNKVKIDTEVIGPSGSKNTEVINLFDKASNYYQRCNVGAGLALGLDIIDHIRVTLGYDYYFLNNIKKDVTGGGTLKNGAGRLGVAYVF